MRYLFLGNKHRNRGVEPRTQGDAGGAFHLQLIHDSLCPLGGTIHLDLRRDEPDGMRLGDRVLQIPAFLCLLSEGNELLSGGRREDAKIFMVCPVFEFH
jgi:hypothetical protein